MKIKKDTTIALLLDELGINRETVVVSKNGSVAIEEEPLEQGDTVDIIKIISGG